MDDWLERLSLLPKSKERLEHEESWPEVLALQVFDRSVAMNARTHGQALGQIRAVLDPTIAQESVYRVRLSDPLLISERDQQVFLAAIQWLGTNVGRGFMESFQKELKSELERRR